MIYHLTQRAHWREQDRENHYRHPSLEREGFIHFSTKAQLAGTARAYFRGQRDLALIEIDPDRLVAELRWENTSGGESLFPHLFGPLNREAVIRVTSVQCTDQGELYEP